MSWCHRTKLDAIKDDCRRRRDFAEAVRNNIFREEFYVTNIRLVEETICAAKREDDLYATYLGEPMPEHLRKAIEVEIGIWMSLHDLLFRPTVTEEHYPELCRKLRPYIGILIELLRAQEEMLSSPLVQHYRQLVDTWRADATRTKP